MPDNTATRTVETAITATQTSPGPASSTGISRTGPVDQEVYLTAHNNARVAHGAQPLTWSFTLADAAQRWADRCMFAPSRGELGQFGENLAAVSDADGPAEIVGSWIAERTRFDAANPEAEGTGRFTQVVWKATDQVGCASSPCDGILNGVRVRSLFPCLKPS